MSKNRHTAGRHTQPAPRQEPAFRDAEAFLNDASAFLVTDAAAIEKAFFAFGAQIAKDLYSKEYIRRWEADTPGEKFPLISDMLEDTGYTSAMSDKVSFLNIACKLYDALPKITTPEEIRADLSAFNQYHLAMLTVNHLAMWCFFTRK